jgi:4-hydroxy-4-methyl-2-oxoglutarate aldolase
MSDTGQVGTVLELQVRWQKIRIANLYDALDQMGYPAQCLDLSIKPLFPGQHLAGLAVTAQGGRDPRSVEELQETSDSFARLTELVFPGAVVVIDCGGEPFTGKFGEMTSWQLKQHGAKGFVSNSYIRDYLGLEAIPDYTVCALGTSPIESSKRWRIQATNIPIALPGTLTSQVRIDPGDWIVGGPDGVIVVPHVIALEALIKSEEIEAKEQGMREDLAAGMAFDDAYRKWGRA